MAQLKHLTDVIDQITITLEDRAADFDVEAIAAATHEYRVDLDELGREVDNTRRFEQTVTEDEFWAIVERNAL